MKIQNSNLHIQANEQNKRSDKFKNVPKPYMDFAEGQERIFTNHLIKQMRKTIDKTEKESTAERYYKSILDDEIAKTISESENGLGIKEVVLNQIYPQYKQQLQQEARNAYNVKPQNKGVSHE